MWLSQPAATPPFLATAVAALAYVNFNVNISEHTKEQRACLRHDVILSSLYFFYIFL